MESSNDPVLLDLITHNLDSGTPWSVGHVRLLFLYAYISLNQLIHQHLGKILFPLFELPEIIQCSFISFSYLFLFRLQVLWV